MIIDLSTFNPAVRLKCERCSRGFPTKIYKVGDKLAGSRIERWMCVDCMKSHHLVTADAPSKREMRLNNRIWEEDIRKRVSDNDGRILRMKNL